MIDVHLAKLCGALGLAVLLAQPAHAFSQIVTKDGVAQQREGIVSVPLPPLAGTVTPSASPEPAAAPAAPVANPPVAAPTAPADAGPQPTPPAAPATQPPENAPGTEPAAPDAAPDGEAPDGEGAEAPTTGEIDPSTVPAGAIAKTIDEEDAGPPAVIVYGEEGLPKPVRDLRHTLMAIAKTGDIEALRPYIQVGEEGTLLSFGEASGDPIQFLKSASGDGEGVELLAIMLEVLEAGHVRNEPDSDNEIFVWPYFTAVAVDKLTKPQKVELFELVTAGDYQEMLNFGAYNFYRMGISPDGKLQFFVAGD
ncbi:MULTISPECIES: hypothetical protein [unclassified Aureimonas]|uniref:hypothetical protein n=1 Tax=unclassified Aureimonas TaxID=2615206 RepID=UPI000701B7ED|nr:MULTISPECIES: hypothetical protein [unclassified Aureimonas]KQT55322.1 hypothetical protein ASG62_10915 [Aureimonas sp. Leaf427]KQT71113.1 hypothetical protein ASG54_21300 [Aureimonas sp. Leaf460]